MLSRQDADRTIDAVVADTPVTRPTVWDSFKRYLTTEVVTKAITIPAATPAATGVNYLVQRMTGNAVYAASAGGVSQWALESAVFYGLMWRGYRQDSADGTSDGVSVGKEMIKDFWLAEAIDPIARPALSGLGQYLANLDEPGQHPYRTWLGTMAGIIVADVLFCTSYLVARHLIKPFMHSRAAKRDATAGSLAA